MRCEAVHLKMADFVDGRCGPLTRARIRRHLAGCESCAEVMREDQELDTLLETWSDDQPSPSVWLRVREAIDMSPSYVPDTPPVPWWARLRVAMVRSVFPYALGAVTTALIVMAGLGRTMPEERSAQPPATVVTPPTGGEFVYSEPVDGWERGPTTTDLRPEEVPLRMEDSEQLRLIIRSPADVRALREAIRQGRIRLAPRDAAPKPSAQPASLDDESH